MSKNNPTLVDLFVPAGSESRMPKLKQAVAEHAKVIKWGAVDDVLADKVLEMIDMPLVGVLVSGWKKYREVEKAADSGDGEVSLARHTFKSEHHPYLEIRIKGVPVEKFNFTVVVELILEGFVVKIQGRKITAVETGTMKGQGSLALESSVILEKEFGAVQLPGIIELGEGIPLDSSSASEVKAVRFPH